MLDFIQKLRERGVIKVGVAYLIGAWVVLQLADVIFPALGLPNLSIAVVLGILVLCFPLALILAWVFDITPKGIARTENAAEARPAISSGKVASGPSIAVLPFPDMSAEKNQEHFCDGLTEELINVLTCIPNLRVASRTSSFSLKGKDIDLKAVAEKLQVAHILEGSVRMSGNRVRITAQLIEAATDSHLWSETYDRDLDDIFAIQDDIAACILDALKCRLGTDTLPEPTTNDSKAYEYFLRGRGYAVSGGERDLQLAAEMFRKAVDIDPDFVRAWIGLAETAALSSIFYSDKERWRSTVEEASNKAEQLAPDNAESYLACGFALFADDRFEDSEPYFEKAIDLDPTMAKAYHYLARCFLFRGELRLAADNFIKASEQDPDDYASPLIAMSPLIALGNTDAAARVAEMGVERAEHILEDYPDNQRAYYLGATALLHLGQAERAKEWAERAEALNPDDAATRYNLACFYATAGDIEKALDCLENSVSSRRWIDNDPDMDSLRDHPRYRAILDSLPE